METLKYHLRSHYFEKQGSLPNDFKTTIQPQDLRANSLMSFKDEYLLDYINIENLDVANERVIELLSVEQIVEIFEYIEIFYNKIRRHSALKNMTMDEFNELNKILA